MAEPLTKIGFIAFGEGAAVALARAGGLFEAQGIEVEVTRTPSSTEQMRGLIQGRWQIASTAFDNGPRVVGAGGAGGRRRRQGQLRRQPAGLRSGPRSGRGTTCAERRSPSTPWTPPTASSCAASCRSTGSSWTATTRSSPQARPATGWSRWRRARRSRASSTPRGTPAPRKRACASSPATRTSSPATRAASSPSADHGARRTGGVVTGFLRALLDAARWAADPSRRDAAIALLASATDLGEERAARALDDIPDPMRPETETFAIPLDIRLRFGLTPPHGPDVASYLDHSYLEEAQA